MKKVKKRTKMVVATATVLTVGLGAGAAMAQQFQLPGLGNYFPWLDDVLSSAGIQNIKLEFPNVNLPAGVEKIIGAGGSLFGDSSKLLNQEDDGTVNLDELLNTSQMKDLEDGWNYSAMNLGTDEVVRSTLRGAGVNAAGKNTNNGKIAKEVSKESGDIFKENESKSYNSSLEAEEAQIKLAVATGRSLLANGTHAKTTNDIALASLGYSQKKDHETGVDKLKGDVTGDAYTANGDNARALEIGLRQFGENK
jgi:hypothetical protein